MGKALTFSVKGRLFAIPAEKVKEILAIKSISEMPSTNVSLRGGITVRGGVIPLFDFRNMIGAPGLRKEREELVATLNQREQDHIDWLDALKKSVSDGSEFRKATDPKMCAFGKWYYSFKAPDSATERILNEFEAPHNDIHSLAQNVLGISKSGNNNEALRIIETAKHGTLARLLRLFSELKTNLVTDIRELAIVSVADNGSPFAVAVDAVENIRDLQSEGLQSRPGLDSTPLVTKIWSSDSLTILEVNQLFLESTVASNSAVTCQLAE